MQNSDLYAHAHLIVSAIRVLSHQNAMPPSIDEVSQALSFSLVQGNLICNKLKRMGIVDVVEGAFGTGLFIKNHIKIEEIQRGKQEDKLEAALKKFQDSKKGLTKKIASIQAKQAKKQKDLFAEIEKKLKKETDKT